MFPSTLPVNNNESTYEEVVPVENTQEESEETTNDRDIIKDIYKMIYDENDQMRPYALLIKDLSEYSYTCLIGYFLTEGINRVANIVGSEHVYATTLLTVAPYLLSRCVNYGANLALSNQYKTFEEYKTFSQRLAASAVITGVGYAIGKLGVFQNLTNSAIIPLAATGMLVGKTVELCLEKRDAPCPG